MTPIDPLPALASAWRGLTYVNEVFGTQPGSAPNAALADVERALERIDPDLLAQLRRDPWSR